MLPYTGAKPLIVSGAEHYARIRELHNSRCSHFASVLSGILVNHFPSIGMVGAGGAAAAGPDTPGSGWAAESDEEVGRRLVREELEQLQREEEASLLLALELAREEAGLPGPRQRDCQEEGDTRISPQLAAGKSVAARGEGGGERGAEDGASKRARGDEAGEENEQAAKQLRLGDSNARQGGEDSAQQDGAQKHTLAEAAEGGGPVTGGVAAQALPAGFPQKTLQEIMKKRRSAKRFDLCASDTDMDWTTKPYTNYGGVEAAQCIHRAQQAMTYMKAFEALCQIDKTVDKLEQEYHNARQAYESGLHSWQQQHESMIHMRLEYMELPAPIAALRNEAKVRDKFKDAKSTFECLSQAKKGGIQKIEGEGEGEGEG